MGQRFRDKFYKLYDYRPNDITLLSYDSVGLVYYLWKKNTGLASTRDFNIKDEIKGKIGNFVISENKVIQKLNIYNLSNNNFVKSSL